MGTPTRLTNGGSINQCEQHKFAMLFMLLVDLKCKQIVNHLLPCFDLCADMSMYAARGRRISLKLTTTHRGVRIRIISLPRGAASSPFWHNFQLYVLISVLLMLSFEDRGPAGGANPKTRTNVIYVHPSTHSVQATLDARTIAIKRARWPKRLWTLSSSPPTHTAKRLGTHFVVA